MPPATAGTDGLFPVPHSARMQGRKQSVFSTAFAARDSRFAVCGLRFAVCGVRFAVCGLRFAVSHPLQTEVSAQVTPATTHSNDLLNEDERCEADDDADAFSPPTTVAIAPLDRHQVWRSNVLMDPHRHCPSRDDPPLGMVRACSEDGRSVERRHVSLFGALRWASRD